MWARVRPCAALVFRNLPRIAARIPDVRRAFCTRVEKLPGLPVLIPKGLLAKTNQSNGHGGTGGWIVGAQKKIPRMIGMLQQARGRGSEG